MTTKRQIADTLKQHLADVAGRGRVIGQVLKMRADLAAMRRQLRSTFVELGEHAYGLLKGSNLTSSIDVGADEFVNECIHRIDGYKADVRSKEAELEELLHKEVRGNDEVPSGHVA